MLPALELPVSPTRVKPDGESESTSRIRAPIFTATSLRVWGARSALSLVDQGFTSGAAFGVNICLARWVPASVYGAFAVAFAGFLFISGFQNVLILEPISVFGPSRYANR